MTYLLGHLYNLSNGGTVECPGELLSHFSDRKTHDSQSLHNSLLSSTKQCFRVIKNRKLSRPIAKLFQLPPLRSGMHMLHDNASLHNQSTNSTPTGKFSVPAIDPTAVT